MNTFCRLLFLLILIYLSSCGILFNKTKDFTIYEEPIIQETSKLPVKTDGIYISKNGKGSFFLYKNGKVKVLSPGFDTIRKEFWESPEKILKEMQSDWYFNSKEWWGDYTINNNEIIIQEFGHNNEMAYKRWVWEEKGRILNDTTIEIYSYYSYWGKDSFLHIPCILNFYPTEVKPDSTRAWFLKKSWYKKNLHESRKAKK